MELVLIILGTALFFFALGMAAAYYLIRWLLAQQAKKAVAQMQTAMASSGDNPLQAMMEFAQQLQQEQGKGGLPS